MTKRTDIVLSVGTLALVILAVVGLAATGTLDEFGAWAWERHHNVLSWYIRVLFLLPFCYFAYKRAGPAPSAARTPRPGARSVGLSRAYRRPPERSSSGAFPRAGS